MSMQPARKQDHRTDLRLPLDVKSRIKRAADLVGESISAFVRRTAAREAEKVIAEHEHLVLSNRDRDLFCALLDKPPEPTEALKAAMKRHSKKYA